MPHSEIPWEKIAVFDINHGGLSIASRLFKNGINAAAFDVYQKISPEKRLEYAEKSNFKISADLNDLESDYDLVCLPVHLSPENEFYKKAVELGIPIMTHHEMVGRLLRSDSRIAERYLIEITGVRGKTSTAVLLSQMLSYKNRVLLHTSEGMTFWENGKFERIEPGISITPAYIPDLAEMAFNRKYLPDVLIFETSLGFTGAQDIGILTEAQPDYMIAGGAMTSTDAKTKMISRSKENSTFVINYDDLETLENYIREDQELIVFDDSGAAVEENTPTDIYLNVSVGKENEQAVEIESSRTGIFFRAELGAGYDINAYKTAMAAAVATALELDISEQIIADVISNFSGVKGRMREYIEDGRLILDNSNSGLTVESAASALEYMQNKYSDKKSADYDPEIERGITVVIGGEDKTVCEGINLLDVEEFIQKSEKEVNSWIIVGEEVGAYIKAVFDSQLENGLGCPNNLIYLKTYKDGFKKALEISKEGDMIISAVKCFR